MKQNLKIEGMTCHHCEMRVQKAMETLDGIKVLKISAKKGIGTIDVQLSEEEYKNNLLPKIREAVKNEGYKIAD